MQANVVQMKQVKIVAYLQSYYHFVYGVLNMKTRMAKQFRGNACTRAIRKT